MSHTEGVSIINLEQNYYVKYQKVGVDVLSKCAVWVKDLISQTGTGQYQYTNLLLSNDQSKSTTSHIGIDLDDCGTLVLTTSGISGVACFTISNDVLVCIKKECLVYICL